MAKKKSSATPDRSYDIDTGIYKRRHIALKHFNQVGLKSFHETITQKRPPFKEWTATLEHELIKAAQVGDDWIKRDVRRAIMRLRVADQLVRRLEDPLASKLFDEAMMLGEVTEQIQVRAFEHAAKIGREKIADAQKMRDAKRNSDEQKRLAKRKEAQDMIHEVSLELALDAATGNRKAIMARAARKLRIDPRTLRRRLGGR